jgi:DNA invertase Pin-like site-specific DNA recombinase
VLGALSADELEGMTAHRGKFVAYFRVSTDRQGKGGLGLEAQREAVMDYLNGGSWQLVDEFTKVESGKHSDRPQLAAALAACKKLISYESIPPMVGL